MKKKFSVSLKEIENRNSPTLLGGESALVAKGFMLCSLCINLSTSTTTSCEK